MGWKVELSQAELNARADVWQAMVSIFEDDEITPKTEAALIQILTDSPFSSWMLRSIYYREICPVFWTNFLSPAPDWFISTDELVVRVQKHRRRIGSHPTLKTVLYWFLIFCGCGLYAPIIGLLIPFTFIWEWEKLLYRVKLAR